MNTEESAHIGQMRVHAIVIVSGYIVWIAGIIYGD
jgi:hypothetical protein